MELIPMDKDSIAVLDAQIAAKEAELSALAQERSQEADSNRSDEKTIAIAHYRGKELMLLDELRALREKRAKAVDYTPLTDSELVDVGDYVRLDLGFTGETPEEIEVRLLTISSSLKDEISIESPLGHAIYGSKVGDRGSYDVNNNTINYFIKAKSKTPFSTENVEEIAKTI